MRRLVLVALLAACNHTAITADAPIVPDATAGDAPAIPGDPIAALQSLPAACSVDGWCWKRPIPAGIPLSRVYATAPDNLWLVGDSGYVLQWNGTAWRQHVLPAPPFHASLNLGLVGGLAPDDMWIGAQNLLYHFDGNAWTLEDHIDPLVDQQFDSIWEAPNGEVWVGMDYGVVDHRLPGGEFHQEPVPVAQDPLSQLGSIWGAAADDFWIAGRPGRMFHYDGTGFTEVPGASYKVGGELRGANAHDIWTGGYDGALAHWDGTAWTSVDTGLGATWYTKGIAVVAADDVWIVEQKGSFAGALLHWNGTALVTTSFATDVFLDDLAIVDRRWWLPADHGAIYTKADQFAPLVASIEPVAEPFAKVWGTTDRDIYFAGPGLLEHFDGTRWDIAPASVGAHTINDLSGYAIDETHADVWAVGGTANVGEAFLHTGTSWTKQTVDPARALNGIWVIRQGEAIAVGDRGAIYRYGSGAWHPIATTVTTDLRAVWGPDPDHAWIVGAGGTILRWDRGDTLTVEASGVTQDLSAIHGAGGITWIGVNGLGPDNYLAVLQSSPSGWIRHPIDGLLGIDSIDATSATDVAIVGANNGGTLFRWNGTAFVDEFLGFGGTISGVHRTRTSQWVAGPNAILVR